MKRKLAQTGLAGTGILLIMAVSLIVFGIAVLVYTKNKTVSKTSVNNPPATVTPEGTSTSPNGIPGGATAPPAVNPATNSNIVRVSAVGMQIHVPNSLKDLTYSSTSSNGTTNLTFSSKALEAAVPACAANQGSGAFDIITRGNGQYPGPANPSSGGLLKQYDNYYFAYTLPTGPCAQGLSVENQNLLNSLAADFYGSLGSVEAL
ncbi:MAG: hypothetical protein ABIQ89_00380 [Candidatus Saccharimonadales bacterium]